MYTYMYKNRITRCTRFAYVLTWFHRMHTRIKFPAFVPSDLSNMNTFAYWADGFHNSVNIDQEMRGNKRNQYLICALCRGISRYCQFKWIYSLAVGRRTSARTSAEGEEGKFLNNSCRLYWFHAISSGTVILPSFKYIVCKGFQLKKKKSNL